MPALEEPAAWAQLYTLTLASSYYMDISCCFRMSHLSCAASAALCDGVNLLLLPVL